MIMMYGFLEGPALTAGWEVTVTCECGVRLVQHISAQAEDVQHDIGLTSHDLSSLADLLQTAFPADHEKLSPPPEDGL